MESFKTLLSRLTKSAVVWSWVFNGFRLASGLILLPLLLRKLPTEELGMYYVFLHLLALLPIIDFGFSAAIGRFVSYAMAGATNLQAKGFTPAAAGNREPNWLLLWRLIRTTRQLYGCLAMAGFVIIGIWGTILIGSKIHECPSPRYVWLAWAVTLGGAVFEIYSVWWNAFLHYTNRVVEGAKISCLAYVLRIALAFVLLASGAGLLSVPVAGVLGCFINRTLSRRRCLKALGNPPPVEEINKEPSLFPLLWPNSWRAGVQMLSGYMRSNANIAIATFTFGLAATAEYGLSLQIVTIALGMASVWTQVKWPSVGQYRTREDYPGLQRMLRPRVWLQLFTFLALAAGAILAGPWLLRQISSDKEMLPAFWIGLLAANYFLEMQFSFWGTLISTENRIPYLWPTVATNALSLILSLAFVHWTDLGLGGLVLGPLIAGILFNYWYWPLAGARSIRTNWFRFMFSPRPG